MSASHPLRTRRTETTRTSALQRCRSDRNDVSTDLLVALFYNNLGAEERVAMRDLISCNLDGAGDGLLPRMDSIASFLLSFLRKVLVDDGYAKWAFARKLQEPRLFPIMTFRCGGSEAPH